MALNRKKPPVQIPAPSASSSDTEDSSSSSEEQEQHTPQPIWKPHQHEPEDVEEDSDEEESDNHEKAAPEAQSSKKPQSESESEEDDDDDDEESDSDDGKAIKLSSLSDFTVNPRVPKSPEPVSVLTKRAAQNSSSSKNKKAKGSDGNGQVVGSGDDGKKSVLNRVWSENDEIALLKGIFAYKTKHGSDSIANLSAFHKTLNDLNLSLDVTKTRLYDKLRALKKKYQNNVKKGQMVFSKPHEEKVFEISEKIWGGEGGLVEENGSKVKSTNKKTKKAGNVSAKKSVGKKDIVVMEEVKDEEKDASDAGSGYPRLGVSLESEASTYLPMTSIDSKDFAKEMMLKFGKQKAKELEEEWNNYSEMEYQLYVKRLQILGKQSQAVSDVLKHSNLN